MKKVFFVIICGGIILGCGLYYSNYFAARTVSGTVLVLNFNSSTVSNKTILPDVTMDVDFYDVIGTTTGSSFSETVDKDGVLALEALKVGIWVIHVNAKNDAGVIIADADISLDIIANKITNETVTVTPLDGTGTLSLTINWENATQFGNTAIATGILTSASGNAVPISFDPSGDAGATHISIWNKGYYFLAVHVEEGIETWDFVETVRIIYNETTSACLEVADIYYEGGLHIDIEDGLQNPFGITFIGAKDNLEIHTEMTVIATTDPSPVSSYQWYLDGVALTDETNDQITIGNSLLEREAIYRLTLIVSLGDILSSKSHNFTVGGNSISITATGHDKRIDLRWELDAGYSADGYDIYRSDSIGGTFSKLNDETHTVTVYSDFFGQNDKTYYYYIKTVEGEESMTSRIVSATSYNMTDEELLSSVQEAAFRYFWDYGHPVSGMAMEGYNINTDHTINHCALGGTGMGLMAIMVGIERGFVTRDEAAERVLKILTFLDEKTTRYHGAWAHWINGTTGETIPFGSNDDGGDLLETSFLIQGMLTVRQYFNSTNSVETEIRSRATEMWEEVDWYWYLRRDDAGYEDSETLYWHWSPNNAWIKDFPIIGFNECMITYLLASASPTHSIPASCYSNSWTPDYYYNGKTFYEHKIWVGYDYGGTLFWTHYSYLGFDPRNKSDNHCNYFENFRNISLIHREYCIDNPYNKIGYSALIWGLSASYDPWGYEPHRPIDIPENMDADNGTITPSAALGAMPYTPIESIATLKYFYNYYGDKLWGPFGFVDAFNLGENWFASGYIAINQVPIIIMIENYRTQLCWNMFMANTEISQMLHKIGWTVEGEFRNPENPANVVNGLDYEYFEGVWYKLPNFNDLTPVLNGAVNNFSITPRDQNDHFAFRFTGYIDVPTDGTYTFYTTSDDGSQLYIGYTLVVNNDGTHGMGQEQNIMLFRKLDVTPFLLIGLLPSNGASVFLV